MGLIRCLNYETVRSWRKKFLTDTGSVKDAAKSCRPVTVTDIANVSKVPAIIENEGRYVILDIANVIRYRGCILY